MDREIIFQRIREMARTTGMKIDKDAVKKDLENLLKISLDGRIEFIASLASLARLASLDSLDRLDRLDRLDSYYESVFACAKTEEISNRWLHWLSACEHGAQTVWCFNGKVYVLPFPSLIQRDQEWRFHADNSAAVEWLEESLYYWHGVKVPDFVILHPENITEKNIKTQNNQEVKRIMIERMGIEKHLHESHAKPIHTDEFGKLFKFEGEQYVVEVINPTPNPDGTNRLYYLPVNPFKYNGDAGRIAKAAIASTWRKSGDATNPLFDEVALPDWQNYQPDFAA